MASLVLGARVGLAALFATAGLAKLADRAGTRRSLADFGVPSAALAGGAVLLPLAELATAVALVPPGTARAGAIAAVALLCAFVAGIARALAQGRAPDCHCFGQIHSAPAGRTTIARNLALMAPAVLVLVDGPGPAAETWVGVRSTAELVAVALGIAALALAAWAARLWLERRTLRAELLEAQVELSLLPSGLALGSYAPDFTATDAAGVEHSREALLERERPLVLVFTSPGCVTCEALAPDVRRWQELLADRITVATVEDPDVLKAFRVKLTPTAVRIDADGRITAPPAEGLTAVEPLVRLTLRQAA